MDAKQYIYFTLKEMNIPFVTEYKFHDIRKFRFDFAILNHKLAIEYEGIFGGGKSRHATVGGYTRDTVKYNLATINGWRVLRYTAKNYKELRADLLAVLTEGERKL